MENFLKIPCRLPFRGFLGGSFGNFVENKGFRCNIAFKCLNVIFRSFKHVKLVTERGSQLRRNILINRYFVQDDKSPLIDVLELASKSVSTDLAYITVQGFSNKIICAM